MARIPSTYREAVYRLAMAVRQFCLRSRSRRISSERFKVLVQRYGLLPKVPTNGDWLINRQMRAGAGQMVEAWRRQVKLILRRDYDQELLKIPFLSAFQLIDCGMHDVEKIRRVPRKGRIESANHRNRLSREVNKGKTRVTTIRKITDESATMETTHNEAIAKIDESVSRLLN